jgi:hypothetical protein
MICKSNYKQHIYFVLKINVYVDDKLIKSQKRNINTPNFSGTITLSYLIQKASRLKVMSQLAAKS